MARSTRLVCFITITALGALAWSAYLLAPLYQPLALLPGITRTITATAGAPEIPGACPVAPLDPIEDAAAQKIEASLTSPVDIEGMKPATALALDRFESKVTAAGGTITLKSAFRPAAYQQHLQNVWYKWMRELRDNQEPGCQDLRAEVQQEFLRHHLIETQHPVSVSDHTRGLAFDATVDLPPHARLGKRRVTVDTLAHLAGLARPAMIADPVHFKFIGAVSHVAAVSPRLLRRKRTA